MNFENEIINYRFLTYENKINHNLFFLKTRYFFKIRSTKYVTIIFFICFCFQKRLQKHINENKLETMFFFFCQNSKLPTKAVEKVYYFFLLLFLFLKTQLIKSAGSSLPHFFFLKSWKRKAYSLSHGGLWGPFVSWIHRLQHWSSISISFVSFLSTLNFCQFFPPFPLLSSPLNSSSLSKPPPISFFRAMIDNVAFL